MLLVEAVRLRPLCEHGERRYGPYTPVGGPIPPHRYQTHQKTKGEECADRIAALAERLGLPRAALDGNPDLAKVTAPRAAALARPEPPRAPFRDPDPFEELACAAEGLRPGDLVADDAVELMAAKLRMPLQIERHLMLAFEEGFRVGGEKPVTAKSQSDLRKAGVVEAVLSRQLDELEPRLTRHGRSVRTLSEQFNAKPAEIKRLLRGELDAARTRELADEMRAAGLPL